MMKKEKIKIGNTELELSVFTYEPWRLETGSCRLHLTINVAIKNPLGGKPLEAMDFTVYEAKGTYKQKLYRCELKVRRLLATLGAKEADVQRILAYFNR